MDWVAPLIASPHQCGPLDAVVDKAGGFGPFGQRLSLGVPCESPSVLPVKVFPAERGNIPRPVDSA
ncbi:hypothetical protein GCM10010492_45530 [Saccharothrix mutabilis subsp. mutabilis]|uniref:Uncharacterized protein n=1 Tax=Saccharothrix mutabilis subsp. mutabilis TaxID=66855 RepID=A0ABP3DU60_9PSEU